MFRVMAERVAAGEPWSQVLADYGLAPLQKSPPKMRPKAKGAK